MNLWNRKLKPLTRTDFSTSSVSRSSFGSKLEIIRQTDKINEEEQNSDISSTLSPNDSYRKKTNMFAKPSQHQIQKQQFAQKSFTKNRLFRLGSKKPDFAASLNEESTEKKSTRRPYDSEVQSRNPDSKFEPPKKYWETSNNDTEKTIKPLKKQMSSSKSSSSFVTNELLSTTSKKSTDSRGYHDSGSRTRNNPEKMELQNLYGEEQFLKSKPNMFAQNSRNKRQEYQRNQLQPERNLSRRQTEANQYRQNRLNQALYTNQPNPILKKYNQPRILSERQSSSDLDTESRQRVVSFSERSLPDSDSQSQQSSESVKSLDSEGQFDNASEQFESDPQRKPGRLQFSQRHKVPESIREINERDLSNLKYPSDSQFSNYKPIFPNRINHHLSKPNIPKTVGGVGQDFPSKSVPLHHSSSSSINSITSQRPPALSRKKSSFLGQQPSSRPNSVIPQTTTRSIRPTTGHKGEIPREYTVCLLEYRTYQVGLACYNHLTGEIYLSQIIQNMTYAKTVSCIETFSPIDVLYCSSHEQSLLVRKVISRFRYSRFHPINRNQYNEAMGLNFYNKLFEHESKNQSHSQHQSKSQPQQQQTHQNLLCIKNKFIALECYSALLMFLENKQQIVLKYDSLNVKWHHLDELLIIDSEAIQDLEIFYNINHKKNGDCFLNNFSCITFGGKRMLRCNLLQPSCNYDGVIKDRQDLVERLLQNPTQSQFLKETLKNFRHYEPVTAKFTQSPKNMNLRSLKSYLSAIFLLSDQCLRLKTLHSKLDDENAFSLPIVRKLDEKLQDQKLFNLFKLIEQNFNPEILSQYQNYQQQSLTAQTNNLTEANPTAKSLNNPKKDRFIFLFKQSKIPNEFNSISRITYKQTIQSITQHFHSLKHSSSSNSTDLKLLYTEQRGYYLKAPHSINLHIFSQQIKQDILNISYNKKHVIFTTDVLNSLNNRLNETERELIWQSEQLLRDVIWDIQKDIEILFQINSVLSEIDMVLAMVGFIERNSDKAKFVRPKFIGKRQQGYDGRSDTNCQMKIIRLNANTWIRSGSQQPESSVRNQNWTNLNQWLDKSKSLHSHPNNGSVRYNNSFREQKAPNKPFNIIQKPSKNTIVFQKSHGQNNSNIILKQLYSLAYTVILSQIGCFIPAQSVELPIFDILMTKIHSQDDITEGLSRFQLILTQITHCLENCLQQGDVSQSEQSERNRDMGDMDHSAQRKTNVNYLLLMDEIVKGTQHEEECALSLTIVQKLKEGNGLSFLTCSDRFLLENFERRFNHTQIVRKQDYDKEVIALKGISNEICANLLNNQCHNEFLEFFDEIDVTHEPQPEGTESSHTKEGEPPNTLRSQTSSRSYNHQLYTRKAGKNMFAKR